MEKIHENIIIFLLLIVAVFFCADVIADVPALPGETSLIKPDYSGLTIPPNIGPMNFSIVEQAKKYKVQIYSQTGKAIEVTSRNGEIKIPAKKWRQLLESNTGQKIFFDIHLLKENGWSKPVTISNTIAIEKIDAFVAYRLMNTIYNYSKNTSIYQYDIENLKESTIFNNRRLGRACINCHSFNGNDPQKMLMGVRSKIFGSSTILAEEENTQKLGIKFGHTAWHPSGNAIAYSIYDVKQFFHMARKEVRDVIELDSAILYYLVDKQKAMTIEALSDKQELETQPIWSPDGKYLYFVSATKFWPNNNKLPPDDYQKNKYSIKRIGYDIQNDQWGQLETVLSSRETGKSMLFPKITPDGKYLIFIMCGYSCFSLLQPDADLWIMDLETGKYHSLKNANSRQAESWHSISSNSRWLIFSSKRYEGTFTRLYISYLNNDGTSSKAFLLPQRDPQFYDTSAKCYNIPEFITAPVKVSQAELERVIKDKDELAIKSPITTATPAASKKPQTWQQGLD